MEIISLAKTSKGHSIEAASREANLPTPALFSEAFWGYRTGKFFDTIQGRVSLPSKKCLDVERILELVEPFTKPSKAAKVVVDLTNGPDLDTSSILNDAAGDDDWPGSSSAQVPEDPKPLQQKSASILPIPPPRLTIPISKPPSVQARLAISKTLAVQPHSAISKTPGCATPSGHLETFNCAISSNHPSSTSSSCTAPASDYSDRITASSALDL